MPSTGMPIGSLVALVTIHESFFVLFCLFVCLLLAWEGSKHRNDYSHLRSRRTYKFLGQAYTQSFGLPSFSCVHVSALDLKESTWYMFFFFFSDLRYSLNSLRMFDSFYVSEVEIKSIHSRNVKKSNERPRKPGVSD